MVELRLARKRSHSSRVDSAAAQSTRLRPPGGPRRDAIAAGVSHGAFSALHHSDPAVVSVSSVSSSRSGALPRSPGLRLEPCSRRPAWGGERSFASTLQPHTADVIEDRRAVACQMLNDEALGFASSRASHRFRSINGKMAGLLPRLNVENRGVLVDNQVRVFRSEQTVART